jgi:hypothetical protein
LGTNSESETKEKRVHEGIAKTNGAGDNVAGRKLKRAAEYDEALLTIGCFLVEIRVKRQTTYRKNEDNRRRRDGRVAKLMSLG